MGIRQTEPILFESFDNGVTLIGQQMPWLESAAFSIALPAGYRRDPAEKLGLSSFVSEMTQRGCGNRDSRQFMESLERLGVDLSAHVGTYNTHLTASMQAVHLLPALEITADLIRRPIFPQDQIEDGRAVCLQDVYGLEDDLNQKTLSRLRQNFYGAPDGNAAEGNETTLQQIEREDLTDFHQRFYRPNGALIAVAGKFDWPELIKISKKLFDDWSPLPETDVNFDSPRHGLEHISFDSEQTHIGVAYPTVPSHHPDYFECRAAIGILSGGLSSRLFHEVREKRGLCYTIYANSHSLKDRGGVFAYSGTSTERAQETLDVLLEQLSELHAGVRQDELDRLKVQIRTTLVTQQESCRARASSLVGDYFYLGYARSVSEVNDRFNQLTVDSINRFLDQHKPQFFDIVTLGAEPLQVKSNGVFATPTA